VELKNQFNVNVPVERAWSVLTDVERIAPCLPGAQLREVEGDEYRGVVKVKVGPITAEYKGTARFVEQDEAAHRMVLRAEGRETRGQGNASATITASMEPDGGGTRVSVVTDLTIAGKVAQFGRGVLGDVSNKLMSQFAEALESTVLAGPASAGPGARLGAEGRDVEAKERVSSLSTIGDGARGEDAGFDGADGASRAAPPSGSSGGASVDLLKVVGPSLLKRAAPVLLAGVAVAAAVWWRRGRAARC